jgi:hypothetical protein
LRRVAIGGLVAVIATTRCTTERSRCGASSSAKLCNAECKSDLLGSHGRHVYLQDMDWIYALCASLLAKFDGNGHPGTAD